MKDLVWKKLGLVYAPEGSLAWNARYAILPTPVFLAEQNSIRVFFGTTDRDNFGRVSFIDLCADNPLIIKSNPQIISLDLGRPGHFDDCGVVPSCIVSMGIGKHAMFTVGFQRTLKTPYMLFPGLALSDDLITFHRGNGSPTLGRWNDRISQGAPCVLYDNKTFRMWHWFATKWLEVEGKLFMNYRIGFAESHDLQTWDQRESPLIVPDETKGEFGVARPWVFKLADDEYWMLFSVRLRTLGYRIAQAFSSDGINWTRKTTYPLDVSDSGWDSEMVCYPSVVKTTHSCYMFYNGNANGLTGFGVAELTV